MFDFLKKKKPARKMGQIVLGLDLKRCSECRGVTRPCEVDGLPCRFHRFVEEDRLLVKAECLCREEDLKKHRRMAYREGIIGPECATEVLRETRALIEWPDGYLASVEIERVAFKDREG